MTETQIQSFLLTAEVGSISRAAELLYVAPASVSKQIAQLEREWGFSALERSKSGVTLTVGGRLMYNYLNAHKSKLQITLEKARNTDLSHIYPLRFGYREDWNLGGLFPLMCGEMKVRFPNSQIIPSAYRDEELMNKLMMGHLDFIIATSDNVRRREGVISRKLTALRSGLVFSSAHPQAQIGALSLADFKNERFYLVSSAKEQDVAKRSETKLKNVCRAHGFEPQITLVNSVTAAYSLVLCGCGIMLVSEWSISRSNTALRYLPLDTLRTDICACWLSEENDAQKEFLFEFLKNTLAEGEETP